MRTRVQPQERVRVRNSTTGITNSTWTNVTFPTVAYDPLGLWIATQNAILIPRPGLYQFGGYVAFTANSSGFRGSRITVDGAAGQEQALIAAAFAAQQSQTPIPATRMRLWEGQLVRLQAFQDSGNNPLALTDAIFSMERIG